MLAIPCVRPLLFAAAAAILAAGCAQADRVDPALVAEHRQELLLTEEPDGAQTVLDVRRTMFGEEAVDAEVEAATAAIEHEHEGEHAEGDGHDHADHDHAEHDHSAHDHEAVEVATAKISELDVVLVGSVGGVANPSTQTHPDFPFAKGKAMFFLADPEAVAGVEEHGHQHAPGEECAFCAAHAADMAHALAAVQFKDKTGKVLPFDARELFDLKEKETVVVTGVAKVAVGGMITVDATGIYVRR